MVLRYYGIPYCVFKAWAKREQGSLRVRQSQGAVHEAIFCNLQRNGVARQVVAEIALVTPPLRNLSRIEKLHCQLQEQ